jgi:hypothetical protein
LLAHYVPHLIRQDPQAARSLVQALGQYCELKQH